MSNKTGITVKKTKLMDKKVKADFKKIFTGFSKAAIMYVAGKPAGAIKESVSIVDGFKFASDASGLAYQLILTALINAAHNLAKENSNNFVARLEDEEKLYDDDEYASFLKGIDDLIEDKEITLEFEMLKNPRKIPILEEFQQYFSKYLVLFGISTKEAELINARFPSYFVFELNNEWRNNFTQYQPILDKLDAPTAEAARRERQWEAYYTYLEREVEMPVFHESFSLKNIFIPLRAYYQRKKENKRQIKKVAVSLEDSLDNWLRAENPEETIKVIQGGPGSGKSSFVKWWTAKIAKKRKPVLFFPLHHFNIHTSIKAAVGEYFKDSDHIPLGFNPLEDTQTIDKMLLVFDGLDELVMKGKSSKEAANAFMQELKDFCGLKNQGKQRFKVLVTGRPIAIQDTETKLRDGEQQILFLLPYYLTKEQRESYIDTNDILAKDQRNEWWNLFFAFKGLSNNNLPLELRNDNMDKITTEPLLNYLVALSWKDNPKKFKKNTNINDVYNQLILGVYTRDWEPKRKDKGHKGMGDLKLEDFIQILEEIAICAWQGGDARVTTERKIEKHIKDRGFESLLEEYKASAKSGVSRLLTAFYFRKFGKENTENQDDTFEFTHKSFGEYLTARAIVELIKATYEEQEENKQRASSRREKRKVWTIQQTLGEWLRLTGKNTLDYDLNKFIINELKIRQNQGESIEQWQITLCEVISELIHTGMPLHSLEQRTNHLEEIKMARNAEEALLVALSNCAKITGKLSTIDWGESNRDLQPLIWFNRLSTSLRNRDFAFNNLNHLNLNGVNFSGVNLEEANLKYTKLEFAYLEGTNLYGTNLQGANLRDANLQDVDLERSNLQNAKLQFAKLQNANLQFANLQNANLQDAKLHGVRNLSFEQLITTKSLYLTQGIPPDIKEKILKKKPELFEKPIDSE